MKSSVQHSLFILAFLAAPEPSLAALENPQPFTTHSGIGLVSGWLCEAETVTVQFDDAPPSQAAYGSPRADTATSCAGKQNTGFGLLVNFNTLGAGPHLLVVRNDGVEVARTSFVVATFGSEFLAGAIGQYSLNNFPSFGKRTVAFWDQAQQNFSIVANDAASPPIEGTYYGSFVYQRSGCTTLPSGSYYDNVIVGLTRINMDLTISVRYPDFSACTFFGTAHRNDDGTLAVTSGTFICGFRHGIWSSPQIIQSPYGATAKIDQKFTVGETCTATGNLGAARL